MTRCCTAIRRKCFISQFIVTQKWPVASLGAVLVVLIFLGQSTQAQDVGDLHIDFVSSFVQRTHLVYDDDSSISCADEEPNDCPGSLSDELSMALPAFLSTGDGINAQLRSVQYYPIDDRIQGTLPWIKTNGDGSILWGYDTTPVDTADQAERKTGMDCPWVEDPENPQCDGNSDYRATETRSCGLDTPTGIRLQVTWYPAGHASGHSSYPTFKITDDNSSKIGSGATATFTTDLIEGSLIGGGIRVFDDSSIGDCDPQQQFNIRVTSRTKSTMRFSIGGGLPYDNVEDPTEVNPSAQAELVNALAGADSLWNCPTPIASADSGGGAATDGVPIQTGTPVHDPAPVSLAFGDKTESAVDLVVKTSGPDYVVSRGYTSKHNYDAPQLSGENWTLSCFGFLDDQPGASPATVTIRGRAVGRIDVDVSSGTVWDISGSTSKTLQKAVVQVPSIHIDGSGDPLDVPVWQLSQPGVQHMYFYRTNDSGTPGEQTSDYFRVDQDTEYEGLLLLCTDEYGNSQTHHYVILEDGSSNDVARLQKVVLRRALVGSESAPTDGEIDWTVEAEVRFDYLLTGSLSDGLNGRVSAIEVTRFVNQGVELETTTQRVEYTYFDEDLAGTDPSDDFSPDLGRDGDLVQVKRRIRLDDAPTAGTPGEEWRSLYTQYRYHNGSGASSGVTSRGMTWEGHEHQLKMVILPEQIEYFAEQDVADIDSAATDLLKNEDDDVVFTEDLEDILLVDLASKVIEEYESSGRRRIKTQHLQSACGCGGGGTQGLRKTYTYYDHDGGTNAGATTIVVKEEQSNSASPPTYSDYKTYTYEMTHLGDNSAPYLLSRLLKDDTGSGRSWMTYYEFDSVGNRIAEYTPASLDPSKYVAGTDSGGPTYTGVLKSSGLVRVYEYNSKNRVTKLKISDGKPSFTSDVCSACTLVEEIFYPSSDADTPLRVREHLPNWIKRYQSGSSSADNDVEYITFTYDFHGSSEHDDDIAWINIDVEAELTSEHGPGGTVESYEIFDQAGRNFWSIDASGSFTSRVFDTIKLDTSVAPEDADYDQPWWAKSRTGSVVVVVENADTVDHDFPSTGVPSGLPSDRNGGTSSSDTSELGYSLKRDLLGRVQESITPGGVSTFIRREMRSFPGRSGTDYFAVVTLPHEITAGIDYDAPIQITYLNAGNDVIGSSGYDPNTAYTLVDPIDSDDYVTIIKNYGLGTQLTRSETTHDVSGLVKKKIVWHDLNADPSEPEKYETALEYDSLGRLSELENPNDTVTIYKYDALDRIIELQIGTATDDPVTVTQYIYDGPSGESTAGSGNGNLTRLIAKEDASVTRNTDYFYDFRDRRTGVIRPAAPFASSVQYDNLDRVTAEALFAPTTVPSAPPEVTSTTNRSQYRTVDYSQRGLVYSAKSAIDPGSGSPDFLELRRWFDEVGRTVAEWGPNAPRRKMTYDGLGRVIASFITDGRDGGASTFDDAYADVYSTSDHTAEVDDDVILEETTLEYLDDQNLLVLVTQYVRSHDNDSVLGALSDFGVSDEKKVITSYFGYEYDAADRVVSEINFGTRNSTFEYGGTKPANDSADPRTWTTVAADLESITTYDERGLVDTVTDPRGQDTKHLYDDLNRTIVIVENHDDLTAPDIDWDDGTSAKRWKITGGLNNTQQDTDRATSFAYDGVGNVTQRVLHVPHTSGSAESSTETQVTKYTYGVRDADSPHASELSSNDLLRDVEYPDGDSVLYAYNRLGEVVTIQDQRGVVHEFERDLLGRVTLDKATTIPSGAADDWIKSIGIDFDDSGRVHEVTSYAGVTTGSTVRNQVEFLYETTWDIDELRQDHSGAVDGSSPKVVYSYASSEAKNYYRSTEVEGVSSAGWTVEYGTTDDLDDLISRVVKLEGDLASPSADDVGIEYDHIGVSMLAWADLYELDVQLDYTASHTGERSFGTKSENAGVYAGYDRFGRVIRHTWVDGGFTGGTTGYSNIPAIVERSYTYDKDSIRTATYDRREGAQQNHSHTYLYDGLDRLTQATRGSGYSEGFTFAFTAGPDGEKWSLNMTGNWTSVITDDATGYGVFDGSDTSVSRDHNTTNELTELDTGATDPGDITYDDAGNIDVQKFPDADVNKDDGYRYTHDAWNRLVKIDFVDDIDGNETVETRGEYEYNGLHHRIVRRTDTDLSDGTLDQRRDLYYTANWQVIDEDVWDGWSSGSPGSIDRNINYLWGLRGIDDLVVRRIDTDGDGEFDVVTSPAEDVDYYYHLDDVQGSTLAQLDEAAGIVERNSYTSYGVAQHHPKYDVDADGDRDGSDRSIISTLAGVRRFPIDPTDIDETGYRAEADLDRDGDVDSTDLSLFDGLSSDTGINAGELSPVTGSTPTDNVIGYHGYCFNNETQQYAVRHRCYDPPLGRFITRDPAGYIDGSSLYEFTASSPARFTDPSGLGYWDDLKEGVIGLFAGGPDLDRWEESNRSAYRNQMKIGRRLIRKGKMNIAQYEAINAAHTQIVHDRINAEINVTQARVDVVATAAAPLGGAGWWVRGVLAAAEASNASVDFCQGEIGEGINRALGAFALPAAGKLFEKTFGKWAAKYVPDVLNKPLGDLLERWRGSASTPAAMRSAPDVAGAAKGDKVIRHFGGNSGAYGQSWTRDPYISHTRDGLGLPAGNTAEFTLHGTLVDTNRVTTRLAHPLDGNLGGADEVVITAPINQVQIDAFTMPDVPLPNH